MRLIFIVTATLLLVSVTFWLIRSHQVTEGKNRLMQKITLAMEGEDIICARKIDDYSWQEEANIQGTARTYGPTLVLYSFKKISNDEFLFKKILVRGTKQLTKNASAYDLNKYESLAARELPPCTNRGSSLEFLNYTLGRNAEATLISRYWMLTSIKSNTPGSVANYESTLSNITSNGHLDALIFSEKIVYRITRRQKDYSEYFTDVFASKSTLLDN